MCGYRGPVGRNRSGSLCGCEPMVTTGAVIMLDRGEIVSWQLRVLMTHEAHRKSY